MTAPTCCFMATAGAPLLPFDPTRTRSVLPNPALISHPRLCPTCSSTCPLFRRLAAPFFSLRLIALMFFLWSTATSSSSGRAAAEDEEMWGWRPTRCPCSPTSGPCVTQLPDDLDHSTSQALTAFRHPQGGGGEKAMHLIRTKECSNFVIADCFTRFGTKCVSGAGSLGDVILATLKKRKMSSKPPSPIWTYIAGVFRFSSISQRLFSLCCFRLPWDVFVSTFTLSARHGGRNGQNTGQIWKHPPWLLPPNEICRWLLFLSTLNFGSSTFSQTTLTFSLFCNSNRPFEWTTDLTRLSNMLVGFDLRTSSF